MKSQLNYQLSATKGGFTLIELLVTISIIAILATLLIANLNASRARARDAQRKSDLKNISTALRIYYNDNEKYPNDSGSPYWRILGCGTGGSACLWGDEFANTDQTYMNTLPSDPQSDRSYRYDRDDTDDDIFSLKACLENTSDDRCTPSVDETWCETDLGGCLYVVEP
jgi:prepilin-type N-terminal cleavage/methylation domain-containing protein